MHELLTEALRRGQQLGTFPKDRDPQAVAGFIQCSMQGLAAIAKSNPPASVLDGVTEEILRVLE